MFDASNIKRKYKVILCLIITLTAIFFTTYYTFIATAWDIIIYDDIKLSMNAVVADGIIFRQGIMTYYKKNKCVLIKYTPYMKYISNQNTNN